MQRVVAAGKLPEQLHEELRAWEVILCVAEGFSVPATQNMERGLARVYLFFEEKRDALIALQKESLMALANSGKANKDKDWNFFRNFMQRVVAAGKLPDQLHEELRAWEVILYVAEGMSAPTTQNMERGLARVYLFFEEKRDALIALQKESLMALANSGKANKDKDWIFFRNFMQRVVAAGKLPDQLYEELRAWEGILCVAEGMSVPTTQNLERSLARVYLFFEEKRDALIALQKESWMAVANSGKANKDKDWIFFRNFMQRMVAAGKLPEQLHEELRAWEVILCVAEGMSVPTTQNMERGLGRVYLFFEERRDALIALQKESLMALANSGKANKDKEWNFFFRNFMQRVVAAGKLSEALRKDLFAWESVLCAQGMSVPAALEGAIKKFIEMVEEKRGMLTGLKVSTVKELFLVHAMKQDAGLRFGYDFVRRQYQKLDGTQQKKVDVALRSVLWLKEQVPLKSGYEAKLHAQETRLGDELPRPRLPKSLRQLYGNSMEAEMRTMTFFRRVHEVDDFMNSLEFEACDYCHEGWFGSRRPKKDLPGGFESNVYRKTNFLCASKAERLDPERSICKTCLAEAKHRATEQLGPKEPFRLTAANYAYPGETLPETDALTFFEEEILSPIQHIVRIFTLYGTGQCELRGHVGNLFQNGPQYVRQIPAAVGDMKMLLIRRCPKDPNRKQRLPFLVSRGRLERALDRLCKPAEEGGSLALQPGALTSDGYLSLVNRANLEAYGEGKEPEGLQVAVVEQGPWERIEYGLFAMWMSCSLSVPTADTIKLLHEPGDEVEAGVKVRRTWVALREDMEKKLQEEPGGNGDVKVALLVAYLRSATEDVRSVEVLEDVVKDELTAVQELNAWAEPLVQEGLWAPEDLAGQETGEGLKEDLWDAMCEANSSGGSKSTIRRFGAARVEGLPILDPPTVSSRNALIREDQRFYIAAGFVKLFPLGHGDYWAFAKERKDAEQPLSFWEWLKHLLWLADGRFQVHPRFYFFALNTALRNKALRARSYFIKRQTGLHAHVAYSNEELFKMGKNNFTKMVSAFEHSMVGSSQEKIQQRSDLEAMVEQLEQLTLEEKARELQEACARARQLSEELLSRGRPPNAERFVALVRRAEELVGKVLGHGWVAGAEEEVDAEASLACAGGDGRGRGSVGIPNNAVSSRALVGGGEYGGRESQGASAAALAGAECPGASAGVGGVAWGIPNNVVAPLSVEDTGGRASAGVGGVGGVGEEGVSGKDWFEESVASLACASGVAGVEGAIESQDAEMASLAFAGGDAETAGVEDTPAGGRASAGVGGVVGVGGVIKSEDAETASLALAGGDAMPAEAVERIVQMGTELETRCRRLEAGGEIPCHFTTLTTAIYQWDDLRLCLENYEKATLELRGGRCDPLEGPEAEMRRKRPGKFRVLRYPGVVAWFTAYKMELFYRHVLRYEDGEGVFEWGAGGIMHLHSINFGSQMPRIDPEAVGLRVADGQHADLGAEFARVHEEYLTD